MDRRALLTYAALGLGAAMVVVGLLSFLSATPHPELATAGATLALATGALRANGPSK